MKSRLLLLIVLMIFSGYSNAQWTAVNTGITNLSVIPMAVSGSNLFAGTFGGGVFLSTNGGTSWTAVNTGLTDLDIFSMTVSGSNVYAGTYGGGVFMSSNNGTTWTPVNTGITNMNIYTMAASGSNVYAGTLGGGVFLSTNNGTSWTAINTGLTNLNAVTLFPNGSDLFVGTSGGGAFVSSNNGSTWTAINTGLTSTTVRSFTASGTNLYAGTAGAGVFLSTNNGSSWTPVNSGLTTTTVWALTAVGTDILAGTNGGGVFLTTNNGTSWSAVNTGLTPSPDVWSVAVSGTNVYVGINSGGGVYRRPLSELGIATTTISYGSPTYCMNASNPIPTISGTSGGVFSSTAGLSINATTGEIDLLASTPGAYVVTYTVGGAPITTNVTIDPADDASFAYSSSDYCENGLDPTPTISGTSGGTFSSVAGLSLDGTTGEIDLSASTAGIYTVDYTTNGFCSNSSSFNLTITEVDVSTSLSGFTITANTMAVGVSYQWLNCETGMNVIAGETNSAFTATANGSYAVEVSENGCIDTSACTAISTIGLDENIFSNFNVYPNPTEGQVTISFDRDQAMVILELYTLTGRLVQSNVVYDSDFAKLQIDEASGMYILKVSDESGDGSSVRVVKR